jgi:cob(I)alamin adenosyltransferase
MKQSYVQIYTGDGKGKTTAAAGLAARAAGRGLCVKFVQFLKGRDSGETASLERLGVELLHVSECKKFFGDMTQQEQTRLREDVCHALSVIGGWLDHADLIVMDEALGAVYCGILKADEVLELIAMRGGTELVLTGRNAPRSLIDAAHLVTEMRPVKHYFDEGQTGRKGIEY